MRPAAAVGAGRRRWGMGERGSRGGRLTPTSSSSCSHRPRSSDAPPTLRGSEGPSAAARPSCRSPTRSACDQSCREPGGVGGWAGAVACRVGCATRGLTTTVRSGIGRRTGSGRHFRAASAPFSGSADSGCVDRSPALADSPPSAAGGAKRRGLRAGPAARGPATASEAWTAAGPRWRC